jgi:hypothetical protein
MNYMNKVIIVLLIGIATTAVAQQTESRSIGSFKGVKVSEGIDVYLKKGEKEALKIEAVGVKTGDVITEISGDYLKIHMHDARYRDNNRTVRVYVTYVNVNKLSASSAGNIFAEGVISATSFSMSASSAATIDVQIDVTDLEVSASSAADIELKGKAKNVEIDISSAGEVDAYDLEAEVVAVDVSSAGSAKVFATKEIVAHASSGGSIRYKGSPARSNTNSSSGGSVRKSN